MKNEELTCKVMGYLGEVLMLLILEFVSSRFVIRDMGIEIDPLGYTLRFSLIVEGKVFGLRRIYPIHDMTLMRPPNREVELLNQTVRNAIEGNPSGV